MRLAPPLGRMVRPHGYIPAELQTRGMLLPRACRHDLYRIWEGGRQTLQFTSSDAAFTAHSAVGNSESNGPPAMGGRGVRLPAQIRRLSEPDRAVVEDLALAGAERATFRRLGRTVSGCSRCFGLLKCPSASFHLGSPPTPSASSGERCRLGTTSYINLPDEPLRAIWRLGCILCW